MIEAHELSLVPQPIVDGWQGLCSCEKWKVFESFYEHPTKDALLDAIKRQHVAHTAGIA